MKCPSCLHEDSRVIDSRETGDAIRRRRSCQACGYRFSTLERLEVRLPWVVKRDGRREPFSRDKVMNGIVLACRKRPVGPDELAAAVQSVEQRVVELREGDVSSEQVGELVLRTLEGIDAVAYVRFASVYRSFESVAQFAAFLPRVREVEE